MKKILTVWMLVMVLLIIYGCRSNEKTEIKEKEYVSSNDIDKVYFAPNDFKGKYIKLTGRSFFSVHETDEGYEFQMWQGFENDSNNTLIYTDENPNLREDEYVLVEGEIIGAKTGENVFGTKVTIPIIHASTIEHGDYITVIAPTIKEVVYNDLLLSQNDVTICINKVEFAENETRLYVKIVNSADTEFDFSRDNVTLIQEATQYNAKFVSQTDCPKLKKVISPETSTEGIIVFPMINQNDFKIIASGSNQTDDFNDFEFNITVK